MKRFATFFVYSLIVASIPVQAATFMNVASPYSSSVNYGVNTISGNEVLPLGVYSVAGNDTPVMPTSNNTAGITLNTQIVDGVSVNILPTSATRTIDGGTYTSANPYTLVGGSDDYTFTNGGWAKYDGAATTFTGKFSGNGNLDISCPSGRFWIQFSGDMSDFSGTINVSQTAWFGITGNNKGSENAAWVVNSTEPADNLSGVWLADNLNSSAANPIKFGRVDGNGTIRGLYMSNQTYYIEVGNLLTNATDVSTFSGKLDAYVDKNGDPNIQNKLHVAKVGAGTWNLTGFDHNVATFHVKEGSLILGNGDTTGGLNQNAIDTVEKGATYGYNRIYSPDGVVSALPRQETIIVNGGTITNMKNSVIYSNVTFNNGGYVTFTDTATGGITFQNLKLTGEAGHRVEIIASKQRVQLTGTLTGDENQEIYYTGPRAHWFNLTGCDLTGYHGTITGGPEKPTQTDVGQKGTWIQVGAQDASTVTFNLTPGEGVAAGLLLSFKPADDKVLKIGALSGYGMVRNEYEAGTYKLEIGGKGVDSTFSGTFASLWDDANTKYEITKVGAGTQILTSNQKFIKSLTIQEGAIQLGDGTAINISIENAPIVIEEDGTFAVNVKADPSKGNEVTVNNAITSNNGTIRVVDPSIWNHTVLRGKTTGTIIKMGEGALAIGAENGTALEKIIVKEGYLKNWGMDRIDDTQIVLAGGSFFEANRDTTVAFKDNKTIQLQKGTTSAIHAEKDLDYSISAKFEAIDGEEGAELATLVKTGAGTIYLNAQHDNFGNLVVEEGRLQIGQNNDAYLDNQTNITVEEKGAFGYNRIIKEGAGAVPPENNITVKGGMLFNAGARSIDFRKVTFANNEEGTLTKIGALQNTGSGDLTVNTVSMVAGEYQLENLGDGKLTLNAKMGAGEYQIENIGSKNSTLNATMVATTTLTLKNTGEGLLTANSSNRNNGVVKFDATTDNDIVLNINTTADQDAKSDYAGFESLTDKSSVINFNNGGRSNWLQVTGDMSNFRGTINVSGDRWFSFNSATALGSEYATWNTNMTSDSGILFDGGLDGKTIKIGDLTGNATVRPNIVDASKGTTTTLQVGALGNDSVFSGTLRNNPRVEGVKILNVEKVGDGTWTFTSDNQVSGKDYNNTANMTVKDGTLVLNRKADQASANNMTIDGGTLRVAADSQKVTGAFTMKSGTLEVEDGKTFTHSKITVNGADKALSQMNGNITTNVDVVNGILSSGTAADKYGNLNLTGNITLTGDASKLRIDLHDATKYDRIRVTGKLIMSEGSKISLNIDEQSTDFVVNLSDVLGDIELISYKGDEFVGSDLAELDWNSLLELEGDAGDFVMFEMDTEDGKAVILANENAVPEPSTWALLLMGSAGLYAARRNRRQKKNA
ncbi:MAG: PEP-CTERM sorting domain-containing protein [Planctomycetia bacterium]|nr:PEP-CTERM sorting domain-containing protein [Planctomycetia bacterium]